MGGIVFAGNAAPGSSMGRFGAPVSLTAGPVPPGNWLLSAAASLATGGTAISIPAGAPVTSDGTNVTVAAAATGIRAGGGPAATWPWPPPWPLNLLSPASAQSAQAQGHEAQQRQQPHGEHDQPHREEKSEKADKPNNKHEHR